MGYIPYHIHRKADRSGHFAHIFCDILHGNLKAFLRAIAPAELSVALCLRIVRRFHLDRHNTFPSIVKKIKLSRISGPPEIGMLTERHKLLIDKVFCQGTLIFNVLTASIQYSLCLT